MASRCVRLDVALLTKFAHLEYKHGNAERGKTMFEKILATYAKKSSVWLVFIDATLKYEGIVEAR